MEVLTDARWMALMTDLGLSLHQTAPSEKPLPITVIPVFCKENPSSFLVRDHNVFTSKRADVTVLDFLPLYREESRDTDELVERSPGGLVYVAPTPRENIWCLVTAAKLRFIKRLQTELLYARRGIPGFFFANRELKNLFDGISSSLHCEMVTTQASVRSSSGKTSTIREHHTHPSIFRLASDWNSSIQTMHISCRGEQDLEFTLFREGSARTSGQSWRAYSTWVLPAVLDGMKKKFSEFSDRGRKSFETLGRPVFIKYKEDVFCTRADNSKLVQALMSSGTSSITVRHSNPYLHASTVDIVDGAQFDVFVTSERVITVVPGYRATESSLMRIIHAVFDHMREGAELSDIPPEKELTFEDVIGAPT